MTASGDDELSTIDRGHKDQHRQRAAARSWASAVETNHDSFKHEHASAAAE
jgi:hypothetical protein